MLDAMVYFLFAFATSVRTMRLVHHLWHSTEWTMRICLMFCVVLPIDENDCFDCYAQT